MLSSLFQFNSLTPRLAELKGSFLFRTDHLPLASIDLFSYPIQSIHFLQSKFTETINMINIEQTRYARGRLVKDHSTTNETEYLKMLFAINL